MSKEPLDQLRELDPARGAAPGQESDGRRFAAIIEAIDAAADDGLRLSHQRRSRRSWRPAAVLAGATIAVAIWLGAGIGNDEDGGPRLSEGPTFAAAAVRVAEANPRLLIGEPGWTVVRADQFRRNYGELTFSDGKHEIDLHWYPAKHYSSYYSDRTYVDPTPTTIEILGEEARTVKYGGSEYATMVPPNGDTFVEIRGDLGSYGSYVDVIGSLEPVDVETWLTAMPASSVTPRDSSAAVDGMLADIPLPTGFDVQALKVGDGLVHDRYQLGARVTGLVTCAWLDQLAEANRSGDRAAESEARQALDSAKGWSILQEMRDQGDYPQAIWDYAEDGLGGSGLGRDTDSNYRRGLGCDRG